MATILWRRKGDQIPDASGKPLDAGKLYFYEAGTTTLQHTYSDSAGLVTNTNPLVLGSGGRLQTSVYLGDSLDHSDYKEELKTSGDVTVSPWPVDDIPAALPTETGTNFAPPLVSWIPVTAGAVTLTAADAGKAYLANTTSNNITFALPSAASVGNGKGFWFKKTTDGNAVVLDPSGSQTIDDDATSLSITGRSQVVFVSSDGAEWHITAGHGIMRVLENFIEETAPDTEEDFLAFLDVSTGSKERKLRLKNLPGRIIQRAYTQSTGFTTSTIMPSDATTPQITEGGQVLSASITPKSATNRIRAIAYGSFQTNINAAAYVGMALFDGANSALAVSGAQQADNGEVMPLSIVHEKAAGSTDARTYSVRAGAGTAGSTFFPTPWGGSAVFAALVLEEIVP